MAKGEIKDVFKERFSHWDDNFPKQPLKSIMVDNKPKRTFVANDQKYIILTGEEALGVNRWSAYEKLQSMLGFNTSIQSLVNQIHEIEQDLTKVMQGKSVLLQVVKRVSQLKDAIKGDIEGRFSKALYICTLFIIREGEDISKWSMSDAESKIDDWANEAIAINDFLTLALRYCANFTTLWIKNTVSGSEQKEGK